MKRLERHTLFLTALCLVLTWGTAQAKPEQKKDDPLVCWALPSLMARYLENHVSYRESDKALQERVISLYADRFDPSKALLLQADFDELRDQLRRMVNQTQQGNCDDFESLKKDQQKWHKDMADYVKRTVKGMDKIDETVELQVHQAMIECIAWLKSAAQRMHEFECICLTRTSFSRLPQ